MTNMGNFTPINLENLKLKSPTKKFPLPVNLFLGLSLSVFVVSVGFLIQNSYLSNQSKARTEDKPVLAKLTPAYPIAYKQEKIPTSLYQESIDLPFDQKNKYRKEYIKGYLIRYFVYKDTLAENDIAYESSPLDIFSTLVEDVTNMENLIKENLISSIDFSYVKAPYKSAKNLAKSLVQKYQKLLSESPDPQNVVEISNGDEDLLLLNNNELNQSFENYTASQHLFAFDAKFQDFLFGLKENEASEIYILRNEFDSPIAYLVVFPTRISLRKYRLLDGIIQEKLKYFSYK